MTTSRRQLWNACLGNLFEHYDTALFGFLSPFLAPLIFPDKEPIVALILTYAIIPLGMLARPIGSLVFGYIGDVYGRKQALFWTLAGMSFVSGCIAFSPTYSQAGILAPIIFCIGRALQNFLAAGETMGGAIFLLENSPEKRHDLFSSFYSASTMGGHLLASLGVFLLGYYNLTTSGWRFLYLFGCITALFGCLILRSSHTTQPSVKSSHTVTNLKNTLWTYRKALICIMITSGFASATYSIALVLMNGFIPLVSTLSKTEVMKINTYLLVLDFCALPFFGWVASKVPREKLMLSASLGVVLFAIPLILSLKGALLMDVIGVRMAFVIFGVAFFAPFHAWAQQLIPSTCRYAVISLGYALGTQALGSPTAALALWCFQKTGMMSSVVWYWMFLGLLSSGVVALALRKKQDQVLERA
ncbi:MAG TPA: MFS transporter [Rhabdochlamydiaceae bacterium]|nr:MFS transporter [Rhabdochlamydiaceae bacterium]